MFVGHYAVGFAAKHLAPRASLGVLMAAPVLLDLLWPVFLALGWEQVRIDPGNTAVSPLDFVPGGPRVGLGLWNSIPGTLTVELAMYAAGIWLYVSITRASDWTGRLSLWAFVAFSLLLYLGALFGPPPPDIRTLMVSAFSGWLVPAWAWWFDRHRDVRANSVNYS